MSRLAPETRAEIVRLYEMGYSVAVTADRAGVSRGTVRNVIRKERGHREVIRAARSPTSPFEIVNARSRIEAEAVRRRLIGALSEISGLVRGLDGLDYGKAAAVMTDDERQTFARKARDIGVALRDVKSKLEEASRNGTHAQ